MEPRPLVSYSGEDETTDENPESQEMLEEQLVRMLTREVMDLITVCCVSKKGADHSTAPPTDGDGKLACCMVLRGLPLGS